MATHTETHFGVTIAAPVAGHTPGPWIGHLLGKSKTFRIDVDPPRFGMLGLCKVDISTAEGCANAALIRNAPALAAALAGLLDAAMQRRDDVADQQRSAADPDAGLWATELADTDAAIKAAREALQAAGL